MDRSLLSDTYIYTLTYNQLVHWVKYLVEWRKIEDTVYDRNILQARRIMELEFALRKYSRIMVEDKQETVVKEYGIVDSNVVSNEELIRYRRKRGGGDRNGDDWLTDMEWGTIFYVRQKPVLSGSRGWLLQKFIKAGNRKNVVLLVPMHANEEVVTDDREWLPVEPKSFCKSFELVSEFEPIPLEEDE